MKKVSLYAILLIFVFIVVGCESIKNLEGNWETIGLIKENVAQTILISNIKFVKDGNQLKAKGDAGMNLYKANIKVKGKKIKISDMNNTGLQGNYFEMEYEDMFFTVLANAETYKIENNVLYLYAPSKNMELQFWKK